ncbi:hypothetical protein V6N13_052799 [Hibiscus sabdariffa]|uniref:Uncharacterized protein n=1 Tax=Hibiscus sabdariffa TaxID=183260 RepID=A0ABR2Q5Z2_9ROSI
MEWNYCSGSDLSNNTKVQPITATPYAGPCIHHQSKEQQAGFYFPATALCWNSLTNAGRNNEALTILEASFSVLFLV